MFFGKTDISSKEDGCYAESYTKGDTYNHTYSHSSYSDTYYESTK